MNGLDGTAQSWLTEMEAKQYLHEKVMPQRMGYLMKKVDEQEVTIEGILGKLDRLEKELVGKQQNQKREQKVAKGDIITFGNIQWQVLKVEGEKALIISKNVVETDRTYNNELVAATWETSDMRKYLNDEFYNKLKHEDKERVVTTKVQTNSNPWYGTSGGEQTEDKLFLLSIEEVVEYFGDSGALSKRSGSQYYISDQYDINRKATNSKGVAVWWWLRSAGYSPSRAAVVLNVGSLHVYGYSVFYVGAGSSGGGVRPALWLNL